MTRRERKRDSRHFFDWLDAAFLDLLSAERLLHDSRLYSNCAFHCQQCAEKALKAYILLKSKRLVDGHNLTWLCKQAISYDATFKEWLDGSVLLSRFYIESRYPTDLSLSLAEEEILNIMNFTRDMFNFTYQQLYRK